MPLEPYKRGPTWWARGKVEYNGRAITDYIRESTGASTEAGARDWIADRTAREERRYHLGAEADEREFTFAAAVMEYQANPETAKHLIPIVERIGALPVNKITAKMIRDLGPELYPKNSTESWRRWVVAPARAVINRAHDHGRCPPIRIAGYREAERIKQDRARGKPSKVKKTPGSWEWLLRFRQHAGRYHAALALFMFTTGARVGQATAMRPADLDLENGTATIPGAKGHDDRVVMLPPELIAELRALPPRPPRDYERRPANMRVFGFAGKSGPICGWKTACKRAGIPYLPPHSAGRHGFGQEMRVRQGVDTKAIERVGGWSSQSNLVDRTYSHAEDSDAKILDALRTGLVHAEKTTGLKLADKVEK